MLSVWKISVVPVFWFTCIKKWVVLRHGDRKKICSLRAVKWRGVRLLWTRKKYRGCPTVEHLFYNRITAPLKRGVIRHVDYRVGAIECILFGIFIFLSPFSNRIMPRLLFYGRSAETIDRRDVSRIMRDNNPCPGHEIGSEQIKNARINVTCRVT